MLFIRGSFRVAPIGFYVGLLVAFVLGAVLSFSIFGGKKGILWSMRLLLVEYLVWLFSSTLLFRTTLAERTILLNPIKFFHAFQKGNLFSLTECMMNVAAFIPLGLLLGASWGKMKWEKVLMLGCLVSVVIEFFQFVLKRGVAEMADVLYNVLGCMIGYGLYVGIDCLAKRVAKGL